LLENSEVRIEIQKQPAKELIQTGTHVTQCDKSTARQLIIKKLVDVISYVDANKTIRGDENLIATSDMILEYALTWNIEEILRVLDRLKLGHYGKFYERLQGPEIIEAMKIYELNERGDIMEAIKNDMKVTEDYSVLELPELKKRLEIYEHRKEMKKLSEIAKKADELINRKLK